jgi:hypothetical protein
MSETQHTVSVLPSSVTAEVVRNQLEAAGIKTTTVEDDGSFRLLVDESDFERAMKLLFPAPESVEIPMPGGDTGQLWFCAHCGEEIQPQSDVCWACGKPRAGVKPQPKPSSAASSPAAPAPPATTPPTTTAPASQPEAKTPKAPDGSQERPARRGAAQTQSDSEKNMLANPLVLGGAALAVIVLIVLAYLMLR